MSNIQPSQPPNALFSRNLSHTAHQARARVSLKKVYGDRLEMEEAETRTNQIELKNGLKDSESIGSYNMQVPLVVDQQ